MNKAHLSLLAVALIYGLFYVAIKLLVTEMTPWETFTLRLLLATPLFFVLEKIFFNCRIQSHSDLLKIAGLGLLGVTIVQGTVVVGMTHTSVFHAGFIVGMAPMITLILSVILKQETLTLPKVLGIAIAFTGLLLLITARHGEEHLPPTYLLGDILLFLNILGWSIFLVFSRPLLQKYPAFSLTSYTFLFATLLTLPFMIPLLHEMPGAHLSTNGWYWMAFVVLFSTVLTYFLNYYALAQLTASVVSVYVFLQPLITAFFGHWLLDEPITSSMILEGALILIGVSLATGSYRPVIAWLRPQGSA